MAYSTGILKDRVAVATRTAATTGAFGKDSAGITYTLLGEFWASVTWTKGVKSMREGALDAYDVVMMRMRYDEDINRDCLILYDDHWYEIESFHRDYQENIIQLTAHERPNQVVQIQQ